MAYENFIGLRYLQPKRRGFVVSIITLISIGGVTLGVSTMIPVLSVMGGFKQDLKQKILGTKAHMVVESAGEGPLERPEEVLDAAKEIDEIVGGAPFLEAEVMASSPTNLNGVMLRGIDPEQIGEVSELDEAVRHEKAKGKLSNLEHPGRPVSELRREKPEPIGSLRDGNQGSDPTFDEILEDDAGIEPLPGEPIRDAGSAAGEQGGGAPEGAAGPDAGSPGASQIDPPMEVDGASAEHEEPPGFPEAMPSIEPSGLGAGEPGSSDDSDSPDMPSVADETKKEESGAEMPSIAGSDSEERASEEDASEDEGGMPPVAGDGEAGGEEDEKSDLPGVLIGKELAKSLKVGIGDEVNLVTPDGEVGPTGPIPRSRPFRIVGIFYTGMYEYDANYAYTTLEDAKDFLDQEGVTGVELKATDVELAIPTAKTLQKGLPEGFRVQDWKELNRSLFYALKLEKIAMFVMLTFIILVASFSIIAMLIMIVLEKKRDISVLKSMGVTDGGIMRIFMYQGVIIGTIGAAFGTIFGLVICLLLIEFGWPLNSQVYYISTLPVDIEPVEVVLVVLATVFISFVATIYPSWKAAQLTPVEGLRYE